MTKEKILPWLLKWSFLRFVTKADPLAAQPSDFSGETDFHGDLSSQKVGESVNEPPTNAVTSASTRFSAYSVQDLTYEVQTGEIFGSVYEVSPLEEKKDRTKLEVYEAERLHKKEPVLLLFRSHL